MKILRGSPGAPPPPDPPPEGEGGLRLCGQHPKQLCGADPALGTVAGAGGASGSSLVWTLKY